jgi:hypothetical protein
VVPLEAMPDRVKEVCFPETDASVQEEGIVVLAGLAGYLFSNGSGQPVALADYKRVKSVLASKNGGRPVFRLL